MSHLPIAQFLSAIAKRSATEIDPAIFKDKTVFVGATAAGLLDLKTPPYSPVEPYPGVEVYATIFSNIVRGDYVSDFPFWAWLIIAFVIIWLLLSFGKS
jgi:adenylate cyclase